MIENERKYILSLEFDDVKKLVDYNGIGSHIVQHYIDGGRIRSIEWVHNRDYNIDYVFTWKSARRPDGSRIEIETMISENDFKELSKTPNSTIKKTRIKINGYGVTWDVDFLYKGTINKKHYLTIAEVELPDGVSEPKILPDFVKDNLIYLVPTNDENKWSNFKLSDPKIVKSMLLDVAGWEYGKTK
jgi:CYTH domain-containing protein